MLSESTIRILHLTDSSFIGGPEKQILHHAADLNSPSCEIIIGSFLNGNTSPELLLRSRDLGLKTVELRSGRFDPRTALALAGHLRQQKITLLCTHTYKANVTGYLASLLTGCPQVGFVRGWVAEPWRVRQYEKLDRFVLSKMKWVACVSNPQADLLKSRRAGKRAPFVIPNAALLLAESKSSSNGNRAAIRRKLGIADNCFLLGAIGRLSFEKGHSYLLQSIERVVRVRPEVHLVILGDGRERGNLENLVHQLGLSGKITFAGFQKFIVPWIQSLDLVVNPSLTEGVPNVVLESMALGTPVVATAVGGVLDLVQDGHTGSLVPSKDVESLASAILQIATNPRLSATLALNASNKVANEFSPERQRKLMIEMYEEVLSRPLPESAGDLLSSAAKDVHSNAVAASGNPTFPHAHGSD